MPIDSLRLEELHIVRKVRDTVRRWWGIELSFTDAKGYVVDHGKGIIIPPGNEICTACLGDREGLRRCNASIEQAVARLGAEGKGAGAGRGATSSSGASVNGGAGVPGLGSGSGKSGSAEGRLLGPCHMGLDIVAAPIEFRGERQGSLFACGFLVREQAEAARPLALDETRALRLPVVNAPQAFEAIARIDAREVPRLFDLMHTCVEEIDAVEEQAVAKERELTALRRELGGRFRFADIVGKSAPMQRLYSLLDKVVESDVTVLVTGENGTGKELIARAIHHNGPRSARAFVAQNCSALNDNLLESELFGHVKGAFTGASRDKAGLFKLADGGTFFLDEVADMSAAMQVKVLRVLQEGTFVPVGGTAAVKTNVRIVAATNKDLREAVARRQFREDLFYRLHVLNIEAPPLRARLDDLPLLVEHFLEAHHRRTGKPRKQLHPQLLAGFYERAWPGNVRELENELERLIVLAGDSEVIPPELAQRFGQGREPTPELPAGSAALRLAALLDQGLASEGGGLARAVEQLERELIQSGLTALRGNRSRLAERLGVSRTTLLKKIRDYAIVDPRASLAGAAVPDLEGDA